MVLNSQSLELPHEIRLIAAVSRLIDLHQSRRDGGAYVPDVPDRAGYFLTLAIVILNCLRELELERGIGAMPISMLRGMLRKRVTEASDEDIEYCIANLRKEREIHYGIESPDGNIAIGRTWDTTPLLQVMEGFDQIQLTENARLLMRVSSLRESWLYSDLDADRLNKAIERGQFGDIATFCQVMALDLATKNKQLSGILERPSYSDLRDLLLQEGQNVSDSLIKATETIKTAIELIFDERTRKTFSMWAEREHPSFGLGNLQSELELVLQNVESLSRRFVNFVDTAQKVKQQGAERIRFLEIADMLVRSSDDNKAIKLEALLSRLLPAGVDCTYYHPGMLIGGIDFREKVLPPSTVVFTVDPKNASSNTRFCEFILRNRERIIDRLRKGPALLSEILQTNDYELLPGESILDLFGAYTSPGMIEDEEASIFVGLCDTFFEFMQNNSLITGNDPIMILENKP